MTIYRMLQNSSLGPEEIAVLTDAYERTLHKLNLVDRNDHVTELVAKKVIELGQRVREARNNYRLSPLKSLALNKQLDSTPPAHGGGCMSSLRCSDSEISASVALRAYGWLGVGGRHNRQEAERDRQEGR